MKAGGKRGGGGDIEEVIASQRERRREEEKGRFHGTAKAEGGNKLYYSGYCCVVGIVCVCWMAAQSLNIKTHINIKCKIDSLCP